MKYHYLILSLVLMVILANVNLTSAFFVKSHEKFVLQGLLEVESSTTQLCRQYTQVILDGDISADSGVIHYGDSNEATQKSYIYPHTLNGYKTCLVDAGKSNDLSQKCYCHGMALHIIQDSFSHNVGGITEQTLRKFFGNNYFGHMTVERNFENIHMEQLKANNPNLYNQVLDYDKKVLNSFVVPSTNCGTGVSNCLDIGGPYLKLLEDVAGIQMNNDIKLFRTGYLGQGFYSTVYKDKVSLPFFVIAIPSIMIIMGLIILGSLFLFGKGGYKWWAVFVWVLILSVGVFIFYSFYTGATWKVTTLIVEIPAKFGYLAVSSSDVANYDRMAQQKTNEFLKSPETFVMPEDATGLSYTNSDGVKVIGSLALAEGGYKYFLFPILVTLILLFMISLLLKAFGLKPTNKFINGLVNLFAKIGLIAFFIFVGMVVYGILV